MVEVAGWAYDAGLRNPVKLAQATAIATAESGRDPGKVGDLSLQTAKWGPSIGLWQIRSLKAEQGKGTTRDADRLKDPMANARAMVEISKSGADWGPWSVTHPTDLFGFARFNAAMPGATAAVSAMLAQKGVQKGADAAGNVADAALQPIEQLAGVVTDAVQTPARIANWLTEPGTWQRILYFTTGGALVLIGVVLVARPVLGKATGAVVQTVVPIGKAGKLMKRAVA